MALANDDRCWSDLAEEDGDRMLSVATRFATAPGVQPRRGFALIAALLTVVLIGALVAGAMFSTTEETRLGSTAAARDLSLTAAESALVSAVTTSALPTTIGVAGTIFGETQTAGLSVNVYVTRLDSTTYWFVAESAADASHSGAQRRVGILVNVRREADSSISITPVSERAWSELF
jgi:type II secretory pathway pseudopilin PulG